VEKVWAASMTIVSNETYFDGFIPHQKGFVRRIISSVEGLTLDCGCGRGLWSRKLKEKGINVISMDISLRRLTLCKNEGNNDYIVRASCTHLPFKPICFNSVLFLEVIEHLNEKDQKLPLREIRRILKPNGKIVITTPNRPIYRLITKFLHFFRYNPEHVHELSLTEVSNLVQAYFKIISIEGKLLGKEKLAFLDRIIPNLLHWNTLLTGKKVDTFHPTE